MRLLKLGAAAAAATVGLALAPAAPASAAAHSKCVWNTICVYYSPNHANSVTAFDQAYPDLSNPPFVFLGAGAGQGQRVYRNGASSENAHAQYHARVYNRKSYNGDQRVMKPVYQSGYRINWGAKLRNDNRSLRFTLS